MVMAVKLGASANARERIVRTVGGIVYVVMVLPKGYCIRVVLSKLNKTPLASTEKFVLAGSTVNAVKLNV
jgi:hypothetical protein